MKHLFAVFVPHLDAPPDELYHRLHTVLRLKPGEQVILFDQAEHAQATIDRYGKKMVHLTVGKKFPSMILTPEVHWFLPLLKRDAFEHSLYTLAELGATSITPVVTTKSRQKWGTDKEQVRAHTIMIAAAEQAKQFKIPELRPTIPLSEISAIGDALFFDPEGKPLGEVVHALSKTTALSLMAGPEGDLTADEKNFLRDQGYLFCALTPTVLRASQAVTVGLGCIRSLLRT